MVCISLCFCTELSCTAQKSGHVYMVDCGNDRCISNATVIVITNYDHQGHKGLLIIMCVKSEKWWGICLYGSHANDSEYNYVNRFEKRRRGLSGVACSRKSFWVITKWGLQSKLWGIVKVGKLSQVMDICGLQNTQKYERLTDCTAKTTCAWSKQFTFLKSYRT